MSAILIANLVRVSAHETSLLDGDFTDNSSAW